MLAICAVISCAISRFVAGSLLSARGSVSPIAETHVRRSDIGGADAGRSPSR